MKNIVKKASMLAMLAVVGLGLAACESGKTTTEYPREHYEDWQTAKGGNAGAKAGSARVFKGAMDK